MEPMTTRTNRKPAFWDTHCRPMITHTSDSHQIQRQSQSYEFKKIAKNPNFEILQTTLQVTHLLKYRYELYPTRTVGAIERKLDAGRTSMQSFILFLKLAATQSWLLLLVRVSLSVLFWFLWLRMDGRTDRVKPIYPPTTSMIRGYNKANFTETKWLLFWQPLITGCIQGCHSHNIRSSQWREGH